MKETKSEIEKAYICKRNYKMWDGRIAFQEGKVYVFDVDMKTHSDITEFVNHDMSKEKDFDFYFTPVSETSQAPEAETAEVKEPIEEVYYSKFDERFRNLHAELNSIYDRYGKKDFYFGVLKMQNNRTPTNYHFESFDAVNRKIAEARHSQNSAQQEAVELIERIKTAVPVLKTMLINTNLKKGIEVAVELENDIEKFLSQQSNQ